MKKILFLLSVILLTSCSSKNAALEAKAKHQAETGSRLNESQKNTSDLFKEME